MTARALFFSFTALLLVACGYDEPPVEAQDGIDDCFTCADGRADQLGLNNYERAGILDFVNMASRRVLDEDAGLDARAANNIVDTRIADGAFTSLESLDAVAYVGPRALRRLRYYAFDHGWIGACGDAEIQGRVESCDDGNTTSDDGCSSRCEVEPGVVVHGIGEGSLEALEILDIANTAGLTELDVDARLDRRAAQNIVDGRPFGSLTQLDAAPYVSAGAFDALLEYSTVRVRCTQGTVDQLAVDVNGATWAAESTREIRTDRGLDWALDTRHWPANLTHAGCYGLAPSAVPAGVPITAAEDATRLKALLTAYAEAAELRGTSIDLQAAIDEVECRTAQTTFVGCRFEFEPNSHSGITWNAIATSDGSIDLLFVGMWEE